MMTMQLRTLDDVLREQLQDLSRAEVQLADNLPEMAGAAHTDELREAFEHDP
jgi:ferritin-like metal-binding protein YciE